MMLNIETKTLERDKTPIDSIAPNPKRIRYNVEDASSSVAPSIVNDSSAAWPFDEGAPDRTGDISEYKHQESDYTEDVEDDVEEYIDDVDNGCHDLEENFQEEMTDEVAPNANGERAEPNGEAPRVPHVPNSRVKAFLNAAFPHLQIGKQPLELLKEIALAITMDFIAGSIQEKMWSINDPRYLEGSHLRLTREDGIKFLKLHSDENPWGLFANTENWQSLQWRGDIAPPEEIAKPQRGREKVDERQSLITSFFNRQT